MDGELEQSQSPQSGQTFSDADLAPFLNKTTTQAPLVNRDSSGQPLTWDGYPAIKNRDGSITTERSITITDPRINGGKATNIPSVWQGKIRNQEEAINRAMGTGRDWPSFNSIDEAVSAAKQRSTQKGQALQQTFSDDDIAPLLSKSTQTIKPSQQIMVGQSKFENDLADQFKLAHDRGDATLMRSIGQHLKDNYGWEYGESVPGWPYIKPPSPKPMAPDVQRQVQQNLGVMGKARGAVEQATQPVEEAIQAATPPAEPPPPPPTIGSSITGALGRQPILGGLLGGATEAIGQKIAGVPQALQDLANTPQALLEMLGVKSTGFPTPGVPNVAGPTIQPEQPITEGKLGQGTSRVGETIAKTGEEIGKGAGPGIVGQLTREAGKMLPSIPVGLAGIPALALDAYLTQRGAGGSVKESAIGAGSTLAGMELGGGISDAVGQGYLSRLLGFTVGPELVDEIANAVQTGKLPRPGEVGVNLFKKGVFALGFAGMGGEHEGELAGGGKEKFTPEQQEWMKDYRNNFDVSKDEAKRALAQRESQKRLEGGQENAAATGEIRGSKEGELPRTAPRENVQENVGQVRQEEGATTNGRNRTGERAEVGRSVEQGVSGERPQQGVEQRTGEEGQNINGFSPNDNSVQRFRGQGYTGHLTDEGRAEYEKELQGLPPGVEIWHSPEVRGRESGEIAARVSGGESIETPGLAPRKMGVLTGQPVTKENVDLLTAFTKADPDAPLPKGGESYHDVTKRIVNSADEALDQTAQDNKPRILIMHNSELNMLRGRQIVEAKSGADVPDHLVDMDTALEDMQHEHGGLTKLYRGPNGEIKVDGDAEPNEVKEGNVYVMRHGRTPWNGPVEPTEGQQPTQVEGEKGATETTTPVTEERGGPTFRPAKTPEGEPVTGFKNETQASERAQRNLEPVQVDMLRRGFGKVHDNANEAMDRGIDPHTLAQSIVNNPRPLRAEETAMLVQHRMELYNNYDDLYNKWTKAIDNDDKGAATDLHLQMSKIQDQLSMQEEASRKSGYEQGLGLAIRRQLIKQDYSLAAVEQKIRVATNKPVTEELRAKIKDLSDQLQKATEELSKKNDELALKQIQQETVSEKATKVKPNGEKVETERGKRGNMKLEDMEARAQKILSGCIES